MKTAEEIKKEIDRLEMELDRVERASSYVARIAKCRASGDEHKWRLDSCEWTQDHHRGFSIYGGSYILGGARSEKAKLRCFCGVSLTFEETTP